MTALVLGTGVVIFPPKFFFFSFCEVDQFSMGLEQFNIHPIFS